MRRREFITMLGGAAAGWPLVAGAQQSPAGVGKVGVLIGQSEADAETRARSAVFKQRLNELGWTEGRNVVFEFRHAGGQLNRLPAMATELLDNHVDVIVAQGSVPVRAARNATRSTPIVMVSVGDAVGSGFVASLARPGGNVTGLVLEAPELGSKRLELTKEVKPSVRRIAVLWNGSNASHKLQMEELDRAAGKLSLHLQSFPADTTAELEKNVYLAVESGAEFVVTMDDALIQVNRQRIIDAATVKRIPVVGEFKLLAASGALLAYGPSQMDLWRRAANYVDRILKRTPPADLPVEQPTTFELVINQKTARVLDISVPPTLLARADEVIE
jgi:putative tryptophan/tyrosine transport system substrate-binding protein